MELFLAVARARRRTQGCCEMPTHTENASLALPSRRGGILGDSSASGRMEKPFFYCYPRVLNARGAAIQCPRRRGEASGGVLQPGRCFPKVFPKDLQPWVRIVQAGLCTQGGKWLVRGDCSLASPPGNGGDAWQCPRSASSPTPGQGMLQ